MTELTELLIQFDNYIDSHEPDKAKAEDKKSYVHEQCGRLPAFLAVIIAKQAIKAARFRYE